MCRLLEESDRVPSLNNSRNTSTYLRSTAFQERVWKTRAELPVGSRLSYTELARRLGAPEIDQSRCPGLPGEQLAVAIPCHPVVRQDGELAGYRWGIERKRRRCKKRQNRKHGSVSGGTFGP